MALTSGCIKKVSVDFQLKQISSFRFIYQNYFIILCKFDSALLISEEGWVLLMLHPTPTPKSLLYKKNEVCNSASKKTKKLQASIFLHNKFHLFGKVKNIFTYTKT